MAADDRIGALAVPALGMVAGLAVLGALWRPFLPNAKGLLGVDYGFWLPNLLAGDFWRLNSGWWALPWFNPGQCGGVPLHANPQGAYLSLTQLLTAVLDPVAAVQASFFAYGAAGFLGTYHLARCGFALSRCSSLVAAFLFLFNGMYSARMMVGHLSFAPFMLLPAMAGCVLAAPAARRFAVSAAGFGVLLGVTIQGGMAVLVLPAYLSLAAILLLHAALRDASPIRPALRVAAGSAVGLALCAGKLAASWALMAHVPRDLYPMPGFINAAQAGWMALRAVFFRPGADMPAALVDSALVLEQHEFDYRVGPAPLALMLAGCLLAWHGRSGLPVRRRTRLAWNGLALLLLLPVALNTYAAPWDALLKSLPVLRSSSSLLRWFAAYMLPACIGAGVAVDRLSPTARGRAMLAGGAVGATLLCVVATDRTFYGPGGVGVYDPASVQRSWHRVMGGAGVPPVRALAILRDASGRPDMSLARQDLLTRGLSPLDCYDPLFGYRLELFGQGTLHEGPILDAEAVPGGRTVLNLRNPACWVYPAANACRPGDAFGDGQAAAVTAFADYRPFGWHEPPWAVAADWIGLAGAGGVLLVAGGALIRRWA